jgi:uncharacterized membrane protein
MNSIPHSETQRTEAFSDAVIAIIMTIMVLELRVPHEMTLEGLKPLIPIFSSYALSYLYLAIYWNNHHHLLHATRDIGPGIMWANMHLLFWLSLIPFATAWVGESHGEWAPAFAYGLVLLLAAFAYSLLQKAILRKHGKASAIAKAIGRNVKGKISLVLYLLGIGASFWDSRASYAIFGLVALLWFIPDRRLAPFFDHTGD